MGGFLMFTIGVIYLLLEHRTTFQLDSRREGLSRVILGIQVCSFS